MKIMSLYWFIVEEKQQLREAFNNGLITKGEFKEMYDFYVDIKTLIMR